MADQLQCVIVDDDAASSKIMEALVKRTQFLSLMSTFTDPMEALRFLTRNTVDLIFLDVEMPGISGLELLNSLNHLPNVIIMSSKREYAADAFSLNVVDYLVKPITDYSRFLKAVNKVHSPTGTAILAKAKENQLYVKVDSALHQIVLNDIAVLEAFGDYVKIHLSDKVLTTLTTMKALETRLPNELFVRVHRSFIVNVSKVKKIEIGELYIANQRIPVSSFYRDGLMAKVNTL